MSREAATEESARMEADYRAFVDNQFYKKLLEHLISRASALEAANVSVKTPPEEREQNAGAHDEVIRMLSTVASLRARESGRIQNIIRTAEIKDAKKEKVADGTVEGASVEGVGASGRARRDKAF